MHNDLGLTIQSSNISFYKALMELKMHYKITNNCRCAAGHFYEYVRRKNNEKIFDDDVLSNEYLICCDQTGFSIKYLRDLVLQSLFSNACFEYMANVYNKY